MCIKKQGEAKASPCFWCERWDSNPHGETTRTSNVLVYHSNTLASAPQYYNRAEMICQYFFYDVFCCFPKNPVVYFYNSIC